MSIKVFNIIKDGEYITSVQVKRKDMAEKFIAEKIAEGIYPVNAEYKIERSEIK